MAKYNLIDIDQIDFSSNNADTLQKIYEAVLKNNFGSLNDLDRYVQSIKEHFAEIKIDFDALEQKEIYKLIAEQILNIKTVQGISAPNTPEELIAYTLAVNTQIFSMGPLDGLLKDDDVTDIIIHQFDNISIARRSQNGIIKYPNHFSSDEQMKSILVNVLSRYSRIQVDLQHPIGDGVLSNGERIVVVIPPIAPNGTVCIIRKQSKRSFTPNDLVSFNAFNEQVNKFLEICVKSESNIVIVGATGSGKTALVSALLHYIPTTDHLLTIEDTMELQIPETHSVVTQYKTRINEDHPESNINIYALLKAALRSFPKYIIVGETRGAEAWEMLQAMKSGHAGITTIHAEDGPEALSRLEGMMALADNSMDVNYLRKDIAQVMDLFIIQRWIGDPNKGTYRRGIYSIYEATLNEGIENEPLEEEFPNTLNLTKYKMLKENPKFVKNYGAATLRQLFYYNFEEDKLLPGVLPSEKLMKKIIEKGLYDDYKKLLGIQ